MRVYAGSGGKAPLVLNLDTDKLSVVRALISQSFVAQHFVYMHGRYQKSTPPHSREGHSLMDVSTGPGQLARIMFGVGPGSNDSSTNISGFLGPFFCRKKIVTRSCAHLRPVTRSQT